MPIPFVRSCAALLLPLMLLPLLSGCAVAAVTGAVVGTAVKATTATVKATGAVIDTAVDATTTSRAEADEKRGREQREAEEKARREAARAERDRIRADRNAARQAGRPR